MRIGVSTHIHVYSPLNSELLGRIKAAGYESVELYCNDPHWTEYDQPGARRDMVFACRDIGLEINSVHTPFFRSLDEAKRGHWYSISTKDNDLRLESVERAMEAISIAEFGTVKAAVLHTGGPGEKLDGSTFDRMYYSLERITELAGEHGIIIALENITNDFSRGHHIEEFIREARLPNLGACYDSGHANIYERLVEEYEEMTPVLATTHIHDNTDGQDNHLLPFAGDLDWQALTTAIAESDYEGDLIIESKDTENSDATLRASADAARKLRDMILDARTQGENQQ